jgi:hypothetical protein
MAGNVWEWVSDWFSADYYKNYSENANNPEGPPTGEFKVMRGGSWTNNIINLRSSTRFWPDPLETSNIVGIRCARSIDTQLPSTPFSPPAIPSTPILDDEPTNIPPTPTYTLFPPSPSPTIYPTLTFTPPPTPTYTSTITFTPSPDPCIEANNLYEIWLAAYNSSVGDPNYNPEADFNGDGTVDGVDYVIWVNQYPEGCN